MKATIEMPLDDYFLLYRLAKKDNCDIGVFIRRCLANYLNERYGIQEIEQIGKEQITKKEWDLFIEAIKWE